MNIYIGNLDINTTEEQLRTLFVTYGKVNSVKIIKDFETDISRGYGFIEMDDKTESALAINKLNGTQLLANVIEVQQAKPEAPANNAFIERSLAAANAKKVRKN